jgi:hypothetical protein
VIHCRGGYIDIDPRSIPPSDSLAGRACSVRGLFLVLIVAAAAAPLYGTVRAVRGRRPRVLGAGLVGSSGALVVLLFLTYVTSQGVDTSALALSLGLLALTAGTVALTALPDAGRKAVATVAGCLGGVALALFVTGTGGLYALVGVGVAAILLVVRYVDTRGEGR